MPYVAIVDDEEPVRKALRRLLRAAGLQAESYAGGQELLDAAAERAPDCVVLDLHMPGMSGLQLMRRLQAMQQRPPIVVVTAHDEPETRAQCLAAGATAYLRKPLDERLLLNAISAALSHGAHARR
ncbi:MAG TPA: response regulator [Burkholderiales bacterium]